MITDNAEITYTTSDRMSTMVSYYNGVHEADVPNRRMTRERSFQQKADADTKRVLDLSCSITDWEMSKPFGY